MKYAVKYLVMSKSCSLYGCHVSWSHFQFLERVSSSLMDCQLVALTVSCIRSNLSLFHLSQSAIALVSTSVGVEGNTAIRHVYCNAENVGKLEGAPDRAGSVRATLM